MFSKCEFWLRSVAFLGRIESSNSIEVDPEDYGCGQGIARPLSPTNIIRFLISSSYYKRFVDGFFFHFFSIDNLNLSLPGITS